MKKTIITSVLLSLFGFSSIAQQRYITTLGAINGYNNNPAYAGANNCLTVNLQGKKQWMNVPNSPTNAQLQITKRFGRFFGFGVQANYWNAALLTNVQGAATFAWHIPLGKKLRLGIAANIGYSQVSLNSQDVITYQTDPTLGQNQNASNLFADAGILLHGEKLQIGISSPSVYTMRLGNNLNYLSERYLVANAQYKINLGKQFNLTPMVVYRTLPSSGYLLDGLLRAEFYSRLGIAAGYRTNSGLLASVDLRINDKIVLAYAYDAGVQNLSGLSKGSHEILLGLSFCKEEPKPKFIQQFASILVKDEKGQIAPFKEFTVKNQSTGASQMVVTDEKGMITFPVNPASNYSVVSTNENFEANFLDFRTENTLENNIEKVYKLVHKKAFISSKIINKGTGKGIPNARITKTENGIESVYVSDENGVFTIPVDASKNLNDSINFQLKVERGQFDQVKPVVVQSVLKQYGEITLNSLTNEESNEIFMKPDVEATTINELITINPIYFDLKKFDIRPDAALELDKVIQFLNENPTLSIEVGAHSDCVGFTYTNQKLSENRALSCVDYIQKRIENPSRVTGKGYGELMSLSSTPCEKRSIVEHEKDRRIEFKIVK